MATINLEINNEDAKLIRDYATKHNLNVSEFICETVLDRIEEEIEMSETFIKQLSQAKEEATNGKSYTLEVIRKELGI